MSEIIQTQNKTSSFVLTSKELEVVKRQFFPAQASELEIEYCLGVAKQLGLNPLTKEIYFVPRRTQVNGQWIEKVEPLCGRDGFLAIAHRSGFFNGMNTTYQLKEVPVLRNNEWVGVNQLVGICEVYRTDMLHPFRVEVSYDEYVAYGTDKNGNKYITKFWAEKPKTMLMKVAESQALRKAFNISGLYAIEELGGDSSDGFDNSIIEPVIDAVVEPLGLGEIEVALNELGLEVEIKPNAKGINFVKVVGNTYGKQDTLKALGFKFEPNKKIWYQQL